MSDAFGADDSSELQGDMPSLGAAPMPAPRGMPSPLAGLARTLAGSRPPPQPIRPGRSPYQFPGQSQVPPSPEPQQGQGPQRRWTGTTASLALPKGSPQPPLKFSPYSASLPRHPSQWGQEEPFPQLPQSFEVPGIYRGLSQFFGQNGSAFAIPIALAMGNHAGDFLNGLVKGQEMRAKMAKEKMQERALALQQQQEAEFTEYHDLYDQYSVLQGETDPAKINATIKGVGLQDALYNKAIELGDTKVRDLIEAGAGVGQVMRFQAAREAKFQDLAKANKKTQDQTAEDTAWGLTPQQETSPASVDPAAQFSQPRPQPGAAPAATPSAPGAAPPAGRPAPPGAAPITPLSEEEDNVVRGYEPSAALAPDVRKAAILGGAKKLAKLDEILADPNIKPQDVVPTVRRELGAGFASELQDYMDYRKGPGATGGAGGSGGKEQQYWNKLASLATKAKPGNPSAGVPGWNQGTFQAVTQFRDESQKQNSPIQRIPTSVAAGEQVINDLNLIQKKYGTAADTSLASIKGKMGLDPLYAQLYADWLNYQQDINVLTTSPSVTETKMAEEVVPWYGSASAYRAVVKNHMGVAESRVRQLHNQWDSYGTGDPMPGYNREAEEGVDRIKRLDPQSGLMPGQTLTTKSGKKYLYTGVNARDPDADENWVVQ